MTTNHRRKRTPAKFAGAAAVVALAIMAPFGAGAATTTNGVIGESSPIASNPNQQAITYGERMAAKYYGWKVKTLDANLSPDKQVSDIDSLLTQKVSAMITWTLNPGAADAAYKRVRGAGLPLIGYGNNPSKYINTLIIPQRDVDCSFGAVQAAYIAKRIPHAKLLVIGGPHVASIPFDDSCFVKGAKKVGLQVLAVRNNTADSSAGAEPIVASLLQQYPDTQAIWGTDDPTTLGIAAAVRAANMKVWSGKTHGIVVEGGNGAAGSVAAVKSGAMTSTWDLQAPEMGKFAVEAIALVLKQHKPLSALPKKILVSPKLWDKSNVAQYVDPLKRPIKLSPLP
jgi:ribose transport system substrate-binding protein